MLAVDGENHSLFVPGVFQPVINHIAYYLRLVNFLIKPFLFIIALDSLQFAQVRFFAGAPLVGARRRIS